METNFAAGHKAPSRAIWNKFDPRILPLEMPTPEMKRRWKLATVLHSALLWLAASSVSACDLCAIFSADSARNDSTSGFFATVSEQFTPLRTVQYQGKTLSTPSILEDAYLDNSMSHIVLGYNLSSRFGISLNAPVIHRTFKRFELRPTGIGTEEGSVTGFGDLALIGRWRVFAKSTMKSSVSVNLLGGLKLPTGDASRVSNEVAKGRVLNALAGGNGHAHEFGGVHEHELSLGSGSFDGIMGATANLRRDRWFFNSLWQYYWRTEGEDSFTFGNMMMISGGPGAYLALDKKYTLSLQANAAYETQGRDEYLGSKSNNTGMTAWYLGPQINFTWGDHLSANAGVDLPLSVANNGLQNVPDYRIHAGLSWRF
jgi:hypothetical protein